MTSSLTSDTLQVSSRTARQAWIIGFLGYLSSFVPLSTDLYLPALPGMAQAFDAPVSQINLTLTIFFAFFGLGTLFWGPLSDKYGRKPTLLVGLAMYGLAGVGCALAFNVEMLILMRGVQAFGGAAAPSIAMAIVKDVYDERNREKALTWIQTLGVLAPIIAPILGALLLQVMSWRGIFWCLAGAGAVAFLWGLALQETAEKNREVSVLRVWLRLGTLLKHPGLLRLLLIFTPMMIPMMAYIASAAFIYQDGFGLSKQEFSFYFSANAVASLIAPWIYLHLSARFNRLHLVTLGLLTLVLSGLLLVTLGAQAPWWFLLSIIPGTASVAFLRPPSASLMLSQHEGDTGSVASLIGFSGTVGGSLGMILISQEWESFVVALGTMYFVTGLFCLIFWLLHLRTQKP